MIYVILFLIIHLIVCAACLILTLLHILKSGYIDVVLCLLVPVFGFVCLLERSHRYRIEAKQRAEIGIPALTVDDEVSRSVKVDDERGAASVVPISEAFVVNNTETQRSLMKDLLYDVGLSLQMDDDSEEEPEDVVPLQEALIMNDPHTRRELMLDVLYTDPGGYGVQLSDARGNDDTEVVHYAVTALVELQKSYDLKFQRLARLMSEDPDDKSLLLQYQRLLEQYLASGLLSESGSTLQLGRYSNLLAKRLEDDPENFQLRVKKADADMRLGNADALRENAALMIEQRGENEEGYLYMIRACALSRDREGVEQAIRSAERRNIYLSPKARSEFSYWKN